MECSPSAAQLLLNCAVALKCPHQILRNCSRSRRRTCCKAAVLELRLKRGTKIDRVQVDLLKRPEAMLGNPFGSEHCSPRKGYLPPDIPLRRRRKPLWSIFEYREC